MKESRVPTVVVGVDSSPDSLAALEAAAQLAAAIGAELRAVYIEDENLLRTADLPFASAVSRSGEVRTIIRKDVEGEFKRHADRARSALETAASRTGVAFSFTVSRGAASHELESIASEVDWISIGRGGWSIRSSQRLGNVVNNLIARTNVDLLLLEAGFQLGSPLAVIYDGTDCGHRALALAGLLVRTHEFYLHVLCVNGSGVNEARRQLSDLQGVEFRRLPRFNREELEHIVRAEKLKTLILPVSHRLEFDLRAAIERLPCTLLVIR
jgi:nucleotide-binding universal stress UspA family protein